MSQIVDKYGRQLSSSNFDRPKKQIISEPVIGDKFGIWANHESWYLNLPGGAVMQFDLSKLTLADFRAMRQNYQLGASLNVLTFLMHQLDWKIECDDQKIADFLEEDLRENWTPVIRALAQAFWAGYAPNAVNYYNAKDGKVRLASFKDLVPEESRVLWKESLGWSPPGKPKPKIYSYNGMYHFGLEIPPENSLWYPLLMQQGDYYGTKLLQPAFPAWYFSNLMHLFANRYFERFGEPLPIGRANFRDEVDMGNGTVVNGKTAMEMVVNGIRNRSVTVLPSDRDPDTKEFDYSLEYLESQMRGADWERYLARLDEEMSLALFTPMLLFRTTDVGSYNLGEMHYRVFQQQLNAIAGDMQYYFQNYLVDRMRVLNFGQNSPRARWTYRKQGQGNIDQFKELMTELIRQGVAKPDYNELGAILGLTMIEVEQVVVPPNGPAGQGNGTPPGIPPKAGAVPKPGDKTPPAVPPKKKAPLKVAASRAVLHEATSRLAREVSHGAVSPMLGYKNKFREALIEDGFDADHAYHLTTDFYDRWNTWTENAAPLAEDPIEFKGWCDKLAEEELSVLV